MTERISPGRFTLAVAAALAIGTTAGFLLDRTIDGGTADGEAIREYLLENPEILPEMVQALQTKDARARLSDVRGDLEQPFPGAVLGNPNGSVTLVEFTDYACGYCRASADQVEELVAANPDLRVVIREWPILSDTSVEAAKMALAAARQGKYAAFHNAMYDGDAPPAENIAIAARKAGLDQAQAAKDIADPALEAELAKNGELARAMGFEGTPAWIVGDKVLAGAVGKQALAEAIATAQTAAKE